MTTDLTQAYLTGANLKELDKRVEKLEIQVSCLRKQVLDLEGKKSYSKEGNGK